LHNAPTRSTGPRGAGETALAAAVALALLAEPVVAQPQAPPPAASPAGDYVLDPDRSSLRISLGFAGRLGMAVVRFTRLDGGFVYPPGAGAPTQVRMNVDTTSAAGAPWTRRAVTTSLDAHNYPQATFVSDSVEKVGDDNWSMAGQLTLRGVTHPLTLKVSLATPFRQPTAQDERRVRVVGRGQISRAAYGVPAPALASDQMDLRFDAEFSRRRAD
jgi:polyisoprenoid-binding protein YceI